MFEQTVICFTRVTSTFQLCAATELREVFFSPVGFGRAPLFRRYTTAINKFVRSSDAFVPFSKILQANWSINILPEIHHKPAGRTRGVPKLFSLGGPKLKLQGQLHRVNTLQCVWRFCGVLPHLYYKDFRGSRGSCMQSHKLPPVMAKLSCG